MKKKTLLSLAASVLMVTTIPFGYAADLPVTEMPVYADAGSESGIMPYADVIVYKHRLLNGKPQYRRWNETRGYWVDPYWIDL